MIKTRDTSLLAYAQFRQEGKLGERQQYVLDLIKKHPNHTAMELVILSHFMDGNAIKPRITELKKFGLIKESGKRICDITKRSAYIWRKI